MNPAKPELSKYRSEFPFTDRVTFLAHASFGPLPQRSWKATEEYYDCLRLEQIKDMDKVAFDKLDDIRAMTAQMIHAKPEETAVVTNTSYGLNVAAWGLDLKPGDKVLLSDVEFPGNTYPWTNLRQKGVTVEFVPSKNKCFDIDNLLRAIDARTKVLAISFVQFFNGFKIDLKTIGQICEEKDIFFVVDGIQGIGNLEIDVKECKIDLVANGGQKWLLSSPGTGFIYVSSEAKREINPSFFGWLGVDWKLDFSDLFKFDLEPFPSARKFEIGTYPYSQIWTMHSSLQLLAEVGIRNIQSHSQALLDLLIEHLRKKDYHITSRLESDHRSCILSFSGKDTEGLFRKLRKHNIITSLREGAIRVAPHFYNTADEMEKLIQLL
ncbi:MAG: aminotransferase class V-fold PLP-dependent enzyme [Candidatus Zixiibacteriota bacterium]|nr:MAG: aminotransferase class V-fold PLP-dependent enzyme [candidate division Zixibacteria bacterium]